MSSGHGSHGFLFRWIVGVLLGLVFMAGFKLAEGYGLAPTLALERRGADAAQQSFAASNPAPPEGRRVVLVSLDQAMLDGLWAQGRTDRLGDLLALIQSGQPAVILADILLPDGVAPGPRLQAALARGPAQAPIVMAMAFESAAGGSAVPLPKSPLDPAIAAMPLLEPDDDGLVRRFRPWLCVHDGERGWLRAPHFATAAAPYFRTAPAHGHPHDAAEAASGPCQPAPALPLAYRVGAEVMHARGSTTALTVIPVADLVARLPLLRDAIVILGVTSAVHATDEHETPLGPMPGAIVLANAVMTAMDAETTHAWHGWPYAIKFGCILLVGALFARFHDWTSMVPGDGVLSLAWATACLLLVVGTAVAAVQLVNIVAAEMLLPYGIQAGSLLPAFAVAMEALVEWGHKVTGAIEAGLARLTGAGRRRSHSALFAALAGAAALVACAAQSPGWSLADISRRAVEVQRGGRYVVLPEDNGVQPDEILRIGADVWARLVPAGAADAKGQGLQGPLVVRMPRRGLEARVPPPMRRIQAIKDAWFASAAAMPARVAGPPGAKPGALP